MICFLPSYHKIIYTIQVISFSRITQKRLWSFPLFRKSLSENKLFIYSDRLYSHFSGCSQDTLKEISQLRGEIRARFFSH